jgi:hypothetical protein
MSSAVLTTEFSSTIKLQIHPLGGEWGKQLKMDSIVEVLSGKEFKLRNIKTHCMVMLCVK